MTDENHDLIIIGAGVAGLGAALYAGRFRLKTLIIGKDTGGILNTASVVENYPGIEHMEGIDLADAIKNHALKFGAEFVQEEITNLEKTENGYCVSTEKEKYVSGAIVIATGSEWKKLGIPGEKEFFGNGVHSCAICDGYMYKEKTVAVIGGSDSAAKEALILAQSAKKVYIIYRGDAIRAEPINMEKIKSTGKIEIINNTNVTQANGAVQLKSLILDKEHDGSKELKVDAMFVSIGHVPLSQLVKKLGVELTPNGEIKVDRLSATNVEGIYAAGDVTDVPFRQAITGVAQGVTAAYAAYTWLKKRKVRS